MWVGVIVITSEDSTDRVFSPLVWTAGAKSDQDTAMGSGMKKAAGLLRMGAMLARTEDETESLLAAADRVGQVGVAGWYADDQARTVTVRVCELTDEVSLS
jgi:hypothetical protein